MYAFSAGLTFLLAVPPTLALLSDGSGDSTLQESQSQLVTAERGIALGLLCFCLCAALVGYLLRRRAASSDISEAAPDAPDPPTGSTDVIHGPVWPWGRFGAVLLPALPLLVYLWIFNGLAYESLFLGDQDFTNLSTALNQTARFEGFLTTPFLSTGPSGSYLGHHFSPLLAVYAAAYWLVALVPDAFALLFLESGTRPTHLVYAGCLWLTLAAGLFFWARLFYRELRSPFTATALMALICGAYPLWRLALSYHYELPVLPLSALTLLALARARTTGKGLGLFWLWLILWMANKEDVALYVILFAAYLFAHRGEFPHAGPPGNGYNHLVRTLSIAVMALAWVALAVWAMDTIGGPERVDWVRQWSEPTAYSENSLRPTIFLLLAFAFLPVLCVRYFTIVLAPILIFHLFSQQVWHHNYLGHYSYAVLPFLMFGSLRGLQRVEIWCEFWREWRATDAGTRPAATLPGSALSPIFVGVILACGFFAAGSDRYMPLPRLQRDARFPAVERIMQTIPADACLQTQSPFSAHAPLDVRVFPLMIPENNPAFELMPGPRNFEQFYFPEYSCRGYYLLLDTNDPMPPFYTAEHLAAFENFAEKNLTLMWDDSRTDSDSEAARRLRLFYLPVF